MPPGFIAAYEDFLNETNVTRIRPYPRDMSCKDPCGYYAVLGVAQDAKGDEIKIAFKAKAQQFHPDRNPAPEAKREFQFINEAYQLLSRSQARANYDARSKGAPDGGTPPTGHNGDPIVCSDCQKITAQPRYVMYRTVISAVFVTWRAIEQGVFCSGCEAKRGYWASGKTLLLGWWGLSWGPIYSAQAITHHASLRTLRRTMNEVPARSKRCPSSMELG